MALLRECANCQASVRVPEKLLGRTVRCPICRQTFKVFDEDPASRVRTSPTTAPASTPSLATPAAASIRRTKSSSGRLGLIIGLAAAVLMLMLITGVAVGFGAWWLLRQPPGPAAAPIDDPRGRRRPGQTQEAPGRQGSPCRPPCRRRPIRRSAPAPPKAEVPANKNPPPMPPPAARASAAPLPPGGGAQKRGVHQALRARPTHCRRLRLPGQQGRAGCHQPPRHPTPRRPGAGHVPCGGRPGRRRPQRAGLLQGRSRLL